MIRSIIRDDLNQLRTERDALVNTQKQMEARLESLDSELKKQFSLLAQTQQALEESQRDVATERIQTANSRAEETRLRERVVELEKELSVAREDGNHFLEDIQSVKQQSSLLRQQLTESEEQRSSLQEQFDQQRVQSQTMEVEQERLKVLKETAEQRLSVLEEELKAVKCQTLECVKPETALSGSNEENKDIILKEMDRLRSELNEKEESLTLARQQIASLRVKESDASRLLAQQGRFEKEITSLHEKLQKQEASYDQTTLKLENHVTFAEQSLEAYKKEMESIIKERVTLEHDSNTIQEKLTETENAYEHACNELKDCQRLIKEYETLIHELQSLSSNKEESLVQRVKEVNELQAEVTRIKSEKELVLQSLRAESIRMQAQMEALNQENGRLRVALEQRNDTEEASESLLREEEAKLDHWREGLESSYNQKRVLKQAMRQLIEESATQREQINRERRSRRALEREMMRREDMESQTLQTTGGDNHETEFGSFEWARRVREE